MLYNLSNPHELEKFTTKAQWLAAKGGVVELTEKKQRTLRQNSYLHVILSFFACEYGCSADEAKLDLFKRQCNSELFIVNKTNKKGDEIKTLRSSTELTTAEMTTAIERFRNWSSAVAGIYLPDANEHQFLLYCQQEIERNREFI